MQIYLAILRSARGASHQPAFMGSCLSISHTCLPCLPSRSVIPGILYYDCFFLHTQFTRFQTKKYSHQVLIYLDVPGIPVKEPLQNS